jgi:hypothetical protein
MSTSIHDHHIRQVSIDVAARVIRIRTAYPEKTAQTGADVAFEGVEAYVFLGDALGTILLDIEPVDAIGLYREFADEMQQVYAKTGGHAPWARSESSAAAFFTTKIIRGYRISSSIGLEGAVWAERVSVR